MQKNLEHYTVPKATFMFNFADFYREAVARARPGGTLVEVGSWVGESFAFLLVEALRANKNLRVVCVDAFLGNVHGGPEDKRRPQWEDFHVNLAPIWPHVQAIKSLSVPGAEFFEDDSLEMVFIDADHHEEPFRQDLFAWWPKVRSGGWVAGHDARHPPIVRVLTEFGRRWENVSVNCWRIEKV